MHDENSVIYQNTYTAFRFLRIGKIITVKGTGSKLNPTTGFGLAAEILSVYYPPEEIISPMSWGQYSQINGLVKITSSGGLYTYAEKSSPAVETFCFVTYKVY